MAIVRWNPLSEMDAMRRQMDRIFDEMTGVNHLAISTWKPAIEIADSDENLTIKAELPGLEAKDLDIRVTREAVLIRGEHRYSNEASNRGAIRSEFRYGKFERVIGLPVAVQNDKVEANFSNGILTLTLPKTEAAKNKVVKVNLGAETNPEAGTEPVAAN